MGGRLITPRCLWRGLCPENPFPSRWNVRSAAALDRLDFLPQPVELATEHLLLGLVAEGHEVSLWLRKQGLDSAALEAEIRKLYGFEIQEEKGLGIRDWGLGVEELGLSVESDRLAAAFTRREAGESHDLKESLAADGTSVTDDSYKGEPMYERFTDRARKVIQLANQEAQRFNHEYVGTEHILLGLIKEGSGVASMS